MKEITGNLWDYVNDGCIVITTNGVVNNKGECVMGRGTAAQAKKRYPGLAIRIGNMIKKHGNHVWLFDVDETFLITFPVKHRWQEPADPELISQSVDEMLETVSYAFAVKEVFMPRPGCGNGGLDWKDVKPLLSKLDDRFTIVERNP